MKIVVEHITLLQTFLLSIDLHYLFIALHFMLRMSIDFGFFSEVNIIISVDVAKLLCM